MTDKQIIIDGVDVNECAYFLYPLGCNSLDSKTCQCINDDCYYKQLKRKEQECEELEEGLNLILTVQKNCKECPHQKLDVDVLVCDLDCATAFKKIAKQTLKKLENKNV